MEEFSQIEKLRVKATLVLLFRIILGIFSFWRKKAYLIEKDGDGARRGHFSIQNGGSKIIF